MKTTCLIAVMMMLGRPGHAAPANPYGAWRHHAALWILTDQDGADLPASAVLENFPLLVRLYGDGFDFRQAMSMGEDLRFSNAAGEPLAYQIETWDPSAGEAAVWVRVPKIHGGARQALRMSWGKAGAAAESNGKAVFNADNGYLSVWHMEGPVADTTGLLECDDEGTVDAPGRVGRARRFAKGKGVSAGETIGTYPSGAEPHTTQAWIRADSANGLIAGWGNEQAQGKVIVSLESPLHARMEGYFSGADVHGTSHLAFNQWTHIVHTYRHGESCLYVNGMLDGKSSNNPPLNIRRPARLYLGGWYRNYTFDGDLDELRVSNVSRPAEWVKLEYENQKPNQTVVGPPVAAGAELSVSPAVIDMPEGGRATLTAKAGGACKIYWILKSDGRDTILAADRYVVPLEAGRVTADRTATLQLKAVYQDGVRTREVSVRTREAIPEPVVSLQAPADWDGRTPVEVVPRIANLAAMRARNAGDVKIDWEVSGMAVTRKSSDERLLLKRSQNSGELLVRAAVSNGGEPVVCQAKIRVKEPAGDPWVGREPEPGEQPQDNQFYARDDRNEGTLYYQGKLGQPGDEVFLKVYADEKPYLTRSTKPAADGGYAFAVKLKPGLVHYRVDFGVTSHGKQNVLRSVKNIVCGDAFLIQGQSNALATDTHEKSPAETHDWIRSYARPPAKSPDQNLWCHPVWKASDPQTAELGYWGMELAKRLVASRQMPIFIINGAAGGTRIDQHQRNDDNPADLTTIYGRALWRIQQAKLTHGIRGILWHQGENNQGAASPTGDFDWKSYQEYFIRLSAAWKEDLPNVRHYYVFQIWPNACSMAGNRGGGNMIREIQRGLPRLYSNLSVMSTVGVRPPGECHFPLDGWAEFARLIQPLIERDHYGVKPDAIITPPNLRRASYTDAGKQTLVLEFDQPVQWLDALCAQIHLDGHKDQVASGRAHGNLVTLQLKEPSTATRITYLMESSWNRQDLIWGTNGIAALTFCDVPVQAAQP